MYITKEAFLNNPDHTPKSTLYRLPHLCPKQKKGYIAIPDKNIAALL